MITQNKEEKEEIINSKSSSYSGITEKYINNIIAILQLGYPNDIKKIKLLLIILSKINQHDGNSKSDDKENNYDYIVSFIKLMNIVQNLSLFIKMVKILCIMKQLYIFLCF